MKKYICLIALILFAFINKSNALTYAETALKSRAVIDLFVAKQFANIEKQVDSTYKSYYSAITLERDWAELTGTYGEYESAKPVHFEANEYYNFMAYKIKFAYLPYIFNVSFNSKGDIIYISFMPAHKMYVAPDYVDVSKFLDKKFHTINGMYDLAGILSVPNQEGKNPLIIIVPEAGPTDKDGSYGENKPYKDLAWGLASNGNAVYRYEKRSNDYGMYMLKAKSAYETYTPREDLLDDLYKIIDTLKTLPNIDPERIYILGHGQGGMLCPLIAKERKDVKGIIMMGANAKPMQENMIDQFDYLTSVTPEKKPEYDEQKINAKRSMDKKLNPLTEHRLMPYGVQATYWIWLNQYNQVEVAQKLKKPMLILHGDRDYQSNMENLALWRKSLKKNTNATILDYEKLNHLFYSGEAQSTYSEYSIISNIPGYVMEDICTWLKITQSTSK
jgi:dienelactone hydrolase